MSLTLTGAGSGSEVTVTPIVPTALPSLVGWWKADALALSDGTAVSTWASSGGTMGALAQATGSLQPIYNTNVVNSLPAVTFDGTDDFLATANFASPTAGVTVMMTCRPTTVTGVRYLCSHAAAATWISPFARYALRLNSSKLEGFVENASGGVGNYASDTVNAVVNVWQVVEFTYDQTNITLYRTESQLAQTARSGPMTSTNQPLFVGAETAGAECFVGNVVELVVCNAGLNASDRAGLALYMRNRVAL